MKITVRFVCRELVGTAGNGEYEVCGGCTIEAFLKNTEKECGPFAQDYQNHMIYLVNSSPARPETVLRDGDSLIVLRKVHGG